MTTWKVYDREDGVRLRAKLGTTVDLQPADEDFFLAPHDAVLLAPGHKVGETVVISIRAVRKPQPEPLAEQSVEPPAPVAEPVVAAVEPPQVVVTAEPATTIAEISAAAAEPQVIEQAPELAPTPVELAKDSPEPGPSAKREPTPEPSKPEPSSGEPTNPQAAQPQRAAPADQPEHYVASGFLGLSDEIGEDEPDVKKPWWKRILPDFKR